MTAPGWYPDERGNTHYWNGRRWTDHAGPIPGALREPPTGKPTLAAGPINPPFFTKPWFGLVVLTVCLVAVVISAVV